MISLQAAIDPLLCCICVVFQVEVPVFEAGNRVKPAEIAKRGLAEAKKKGVDVVIVDTAGRLQVDRGMMDELKQIKQAVTPTEVLLVVDAMTGQEAAGPNKISACKNARKMWLIAFKELISTVGSGSYNGVTFHYVCVAVAILRLCSNLLRYIRLHLD